MGYTTRPSQMLLTLPYASPERAVHLKSGDARVDIWSIRVIYYSLLPGKLTYYANLCWVSLG